MKTVAYLRVSTDAQDLKNQEHEILKYAHQQDFKVDEWVKVKVSSRKDTRERKIDELLGRLNQGDRLIVAELSRLGRSVGEIILIVNELIQAGVNIRILKENMNLNGKQDIQTKVMVTMFGLFAEIERDLISQRTKAGLAKARAEGKLLGRPKGKGKSRLDGKESEIKELLAKGVSKASIAKIMGVKWPTLDYFIKTRGLCNVAIY